MNALQALNSEGLHCSETALDVVDELLQAEQLQYGALQRLLADVTDSARIYGRDSNGVPVRTFEPTVDSRLPGVSSDKPRSR